MARSYWDTERVELHGEILPISARCWKSRHELDRDLRNSQTSWRDLRNLGKMEDISPQSRQDLKSRKHHGGFSTNLGEISVISSRWRKSCRHLAAISPRFRISQTSWWDLYSLGEISVISVRSQQSQQDGRYLAAISCWDLESKQLNFVSHTCTHCGPFFFRWKDICPTKTPSWSDKTNCARTSLNLKKQDLLMVDSYSSLLYNDLQ